VGRAERGVIRRKSRGREATGGSWWGGEGEGREEGDWRRRGEEDGGAAGKG